MYCPNCKQEHEGKFCPECGTKLVEKPAKAGGFSINLGDANAISGGINLSDSHNVHKEDNSVHNTSNVSNVTNNTSSVTNVTNVAAQKTDMEILQEKKTLYLNECKRAYEDNVLEQSEVIALEECRIKLGLDKVTADAILDSVRVMTERNARKTSLNPIARTKLKILTDNLKKNEVKALMDQIDGLEALVKKYEHDELSRKYFLVLAALKPEKCIELKESSKIDSYWKSYWSYLAYLKVGQQREAEETLMSMDRFKDYPEDNMTVLAVAGAMMNGNMEEAKEYLSAIVGDYTPALQCFVDSVYLILDPEMAKEMGANENTCAFYLVNFFNKKDSTSLNTKTIPVNVNQGTSVFKVNGVTFEMIKVQGGTFMMGATSEQEDDANDDEIPVHKVTLSDNSIGKYEVTQALWQAVMDDNPSEYEGDDNPVENVSWDDCQAFIAELNSLTGKRFCLPTEAEWEYAARGGNKSRGYKYSGSNDVDDVAWYDDNSDDQTHPVGTKKPNELGIYDMSGNVYEWCQDWYGDYGSGSQTNPTGDNNGSYRVYRGGGWYGNAGRCRSSFRDCGDPGYRCIGLGLRLVLSE